MIMTTLMILLAVQVAASDLYGRRVSNRVLLCAVVIIVALHGYGWLLQGKGSPFVFLAGLGSGLLALLPFYAIGWMGAGDVKYFAVIGLALGLQMLLPVWLVGSALAGGHAAWVLASRYSLTLQVLQARWRRRLEGLAWWRHVGLARQGRSGIPYAAYLSVGVVAVCLRGVPQ